MCLSIEKYSVWSRKNTAVPKHKFSKKIEESNLVNNGDVKFFVSADKRKSLQGCC